MPVSSIHSMTRGICSRRTWSRRSRPAIVAAVGSPLHRDDTCKVRSSSPRTSSKGRSWLPVARPRGTAEHRSDGRMAAASKRRGDRRVRRAAPSPRAPSSRDDAQVSLPRSRAAKVVSVALARQQWTPLRQAMTSDATAHRPGSALGPTSWLGSPSPDGRRTEGCRPADRRSMSRSSRRSFRMPSRVRDFTVPWGIEPERDGRLRQVAEIHQGDHLVLLDGKLTECGPHDPTIS